MNKFSTLLTSVVLLTASAAPSIASAADYRTTFDGPPAYNWNGFYAGIQGGYSQGHVDFQQVDPKVQGWEYGLVGGFNYKVGNSPFLVGIEADIAKTTEKGNFHSGYDDQLGDHFSVTTKASLDWTASLRGRAGILLGEDQRVLIYGTGGVAWAGGNASMKNIGSYGTATWNADAASAKFNARGYVWGAGIEAFLTPKISAGVEVLHTQYNNVKIRQSYEMYDNTVNVRVPSDNRVMARLTFHF